MHANRVDGVLPYDMNPQDPDEMTTADMFNHMSMLSMSFTQSSIASKERYKHAVEVMNREIPNLEKMSVDGVYRCPFDVDPTNDDDLNETILDPIVSQTKGRKKAERFKSPVESFGKEKPKRKCKRCNNEGHDRRNCPIIEK